MKRFLVFSILLFAQQMQQAVINTPTAAVTTPVTGMYLWYSADCITFVSSVCGTPSNGTTNFAWADRSGTGDNMAYSQGTCTFNTNQVNSLPAVTLSSCEMTMTAVPNSVGHTLFIVMKTTSAASSGTNYIFGSTISGLGWTSATTGGAQTMAQVSINNPQVGTTHLSSGVWTQANAYVTNASSTYDAGMRIASATDTLTTSTSTNYTDNSPNCFGAYCHGAVSNFFVGQIAEVIFYRFTLNAGQIQQNEAYFRAKYGIS